MTEKDGITDKTLSAKIVFNFYNLFAIITCWNNKSFRSLFIHIRENTTAAEVVIKKLIY